MDLYKKFQNSPTVDFSILSNSSMNKNVTSLIQELIVSYDKELLKGTINTNLLKSYHMILCNEYLLKKNDKLPENENLSISVFQMDLLSKLKEFSQEQLLIIYDIIILKLISNPTNIYKELEKFQKNDNFFEEKETRVFYMKILECFLDALRLLQFLNPKFEKAENLSLFFSNNLESWYKTKDDSEWKSLISFLPKLMEVTGFESLKLFWNLLQNKKELKTSLTGLCIFVNFALETKFQEKENLLPFFTDDKFWEIILTGLKSSLELERKEALYLFKIVTEFLQSQNLRKNIFNVPFTCEKNSESIKIVRNNFILILESLEEKKQHMVLPSFSVLNYLISESLNHQNCGNCFDFSWLSCIFEKILQHENNAIIKSGLSYILKINPELYNDDFIKSLAKTLNNRFLYEWEDNQPPKIIEELENLFNEAEILKIEFLSKFLSAIAEISWDPVSIFYITFVLSCANESFHFPWKEDQLINMKILIEKNLRLHSPFLRKESQINTILAMTRFTKEIDLRTFANFLSAFPSDDEILSRNSKSSKIILDWLKFRNIKDSQVENFICKFCENIRDGILTNIESFVRVFIFLCDSNFLKKESKVLINIIDLLCNIQSIKSRLYINFELANRILELIYHFVKLSNSSDISWEIVFPFLDSALDFLLISGRKPNLSYENVQKYSTVFNLLSKTLMIQKNEGYFLKNFEEEAIFTLQNANNCSGLRRLYGINILQFCQELKNGFLNPDIFSLLLTVYATPLTFGEEESLSGIKGKATTEYYTIISKIINCHLEKSTEISENFLFHASKLFDKAGTSGVSFIIGILSEILKKKLISQKDFDQAEILIRACWKSIFSEKKNRSFWTAFDKILKLILNPDCLGFENDLVHEFVNEILQEGEAAPNLKIVFLKNLENLNPKCYFYFREAILNCLLHGKVLRRDEKIESQTIAFLKKENEFYLNQNDLEVRARAVTLFYKAITQDKNYSIAIFPLLMKKLEKFKGKRYFGDSISHRIQQRIFQVLLILEPVLNEECTEKLKKEIIDIILSNSADQPSIQIMMSWILSRIYSRNDNNSLWDFFKEVKEKRPGNLKFVAGVILQISKIIKEDESLKKFLSTAISSLSSECLGPTFNTRLACQIILVKLYERLEEKDNLYEAIIKTLNERNVQIINEFYYNSFHLLDNYSLQSIYYQVPRLTNVSEDELIPPIVFEALQFSKSQTHPLKLLDESNLLNQLNSFPSGIKHLEKNEISNDDIHSFDLQKKIVPQKSTFFEDQESDLNKRNIVVVASLVERVPNLGGIARTCEIFGARELILGNKKCMENKEFQSLSVTAEKWIKITEVKPQDLLKYLLEMKDSGWKIVGLEQTAHSSSLLETKFEKKTVLLLGNEKDGIPPYLIPILDICVEIPQIGVIRSLNVHVTGAICVWEYAKQHSFL